MYFLSIQNTSNTKDPKVHLKDPPYPIFGDKRALPKEPSSLPPPTPSSRAPWVTPDQPSASVLALLLLKAHSDLPHECRLPGVSLSPLFHSL